MESLQGIYGATLLMDMPRTIFALLRTAGEAKENFQLMVSSPKDARLPQQLSASLFNLVFGGEKRCFLTKEVEVLRGQKPLTGVFVALEDSIKIIDRERLLYDIPVTVFSHLRIHRSKRTLTLFLTDGKAIALRGSQSDLGLIWSTLKMLIL
eukprot:TRINITY_DN2934_c0_g2_i2.p1 TRINITY_DN2934_c0_g2~~TRINITY_DN2934_c0_g2_i2.p1  ORF type:complete len:152 (+),score=36.55 TRINITY_DN2934_c0_g2_i2:299-754(+)